MNPIRKAIRQWNDGSLEGIARILVNLPVDWGTPQPWIEAGKAFHRYTERSFEAMEEFVGTYLAKHGEREEPCVDAALDHSLKYKTSRKVHELLREMSLRKYL
ncbi:MAG TPA: hypothetical protein VLJ21_00755 [Candidatus Binatia bacterium]|nr:hypothetical protein [Candidatus Binatia bacterium]